MKSALAHSHICGRDSPAEWKLDHLSQGEMLSLYIYIYIYSITIYRKYIFFFSRFFAFWLLSGILSTVIKFPNILSFMIVSDNFPRQVRISDFQFSNVTFPSPSCLLNSIYSSEIYNETVLIQNLIFKNDTSLRILTFCLNLDVKSA